jgi:acyl-CoA synthetase (AMP-forming)/AMP-acid ligase II
MQISVIRHCQPGDVMMASTPIYSNTTLSCALVPVLARGAAVVLMGKFDARRFLEQAERWRATHAVLVPVQVGRILADPEFDRFDLSAFRHKLCTGAPFPVELKRDAVARWPGAMVEVYSMSEGGPAAGFDATAHPDKLHTVGKPSIGADVRIVGEDGRELGSGQIGEVVGHSRTMMTGYHNQPEATLAAEWRDSTGKRFIRSGDLGCFDEDGFLVIVGRKKDMIISGGLNVYPSDIEAVLAQNPAVAEAAVVGAPSRRWGETPVAFVTPAKGAVRDPEALAREILAWTNLRVGKAQRLAAVKLVDDLPRNHLGKVLKRDLRSRCEAFA